MPLPLPLNPLGVSAFRNPYVTDGLIAMFDGEWNAGIGKHSSSAAVWHNLAGTETPEKTSAISWGDNFAIYGSSSNLGVVIPLNTPGIRHIEVVVRCTSTTSTQFIVTGSVKASLVAYGGKMILTNGSRNLSGTFVGTNREYALSVSFDGNVATSAWMDGETMAVETGTTSVTASNFSNTQLRIGARSSGGNPFIGRIYCVRAYTRALTAAEVAANYSVDQRRFGI